MSIPRRIDRPLQASHPADRKQARIACLARRAAGFSLLDLVTGLSLLLVVALLGAPVSSNTTLIRRNQLRREALAASQSITTDLRSRGVRLLPNSGSERLLFATGEDNFEVEVGYCTRPSFCSPRVRQLHLVVSLEGRAVYVTDIIVSDLA